MAVLDEGPLQVLGEVSSQVSQCEQNKRGNVPGAKKADA